MSNPFASFQAFSFLCETILTDVGHFFTVHRTEGGLEVNVTGPVQATIKIPLSGAAAKAADAVQVAETIAEEIKG